MSAVISVVGLLLLAASSWTLGTVVLQRMTCADLHAYERVALKLLAGLGLVAICLSLLTLAGGFAYIKVFVDALAVAGVALAVREIWVMPGGARSVAANWRFATVLVLAAAGLGCLGAVAPVTDDDALAYVIPIAGHIAKTGHLTVWPDQARSMWPQSQQMLLAYLLSLGGDRLGLLTAFEFLLALGVASALARRACERSDHIAPALIVAFGSPVVAFQIASAKEDLLVVAATTAAAVSLIGARRTADYAIAGLFAGIAAGAKYPGLAIAAAAVAWPFVARRQSPARAALVVAVCAAATGGLWYLLNLSRYGNPVAPFLFGASGTTLDVATVQQFVDAYGAGRSVPAFLVAPIRIFLEPGLFCGRANLYNPIVYLSLVGLAIPSIRRRHAPLFLAALVMYIVWFFGLQNARFLLPVAVLLAPATADVAMPAISRWRALWPIAAAAAVVSLGVVAAVGSVRAVRYFRSPDVFLSRETQNYDDLQWMNAHLDPRSNRVGSDHKVLAHLDIPWIVLDATYQLEIARAEFGDPQRFLEACQRQGITHLFGRSDSFAAIRGSLRPIHENPVSRRGGVRFFREPPTESTTVFEIVGARGAS